KVLANIQGITPSILITSYENNNLMNYSTFTYSLVQTRSKFEFSNTISVGCYKILNHLDK
ncbi:MAG: hypothetical protein ACK5NF_01430, partial [Bacilli bacterium]